MTGTILFWISVYLLIGYLIVFTGALLSPAGEAEADVQDFAPKRILLMTVMWGGFALWILWRLISGPILLVRDFKLKRARKAS